MEIEITPDMVGKVLTLVEQTKTDPEPDLTQGKDLFVWRGVSPRDANIYNAWAQEIATTRQRRHQRYVLPDGQVIEVSMRSVPPRIIEDGQVIQATVRKGTKDPSGHVEWVPRHDDLIVGSYLKIGHTYAWSLSARLDTLSRVMQYPNTHVTFCQIWGPHNRGNPIALQFYRGKYRVQGYQDGVNFGLPDGNWHSWVLLYRPHVTDGKISAWFDGRLVYSVEGVQTAQESPREGWGGQQRFGCYTPPTAEDTAVSLRDFRFMELG